MGWMRPTMPLRIFDDVTKNKRKDWCLTTALTLFFSSHSPSQDVLQSLQKWKDIFKELKLVHDAWSPSECMVGIKSTINLCPRGLLTGFHPVWDISYQKHCFLVQILWLRRFDKAPTYNIRLAGANLQIWPIVLQENNQTSIFFMCASANQLCDNWIRSPKDHLDFSLKHNQLSTLWYISNIGQMVLRGKCEP